MRKNTSFRSAIKFSSVCGITLIAVIAAFTACNKSKPVTATGLTQEQLRASAAKPLLQNEPITTVVTVVDVTPDLDCKSVRAIFHPNAEIFTVHDPAVIATLKTALASHRAVQITFDPWQATVSQASIASAGYQATIDSREIVNSPQTSHPINLSEVSGEIIDRPTEMAALNLTTTGLTNVIPDFATAQLMFDYIAHQSCQSPGPYAIDFCISFQYCEDGCYARAHKMCWIINNKYHYGTQKVFSFGTPSPYELSVKAEKWGGCCINWWYHVAPLVTIQTTKGPKAFVFDPAMFDQPVLLSTWLHAQQNPDCQGGYTARVTSFNIQPTASYAPYSTTVFMNDPFYTDTDSTLVNYRHLISCP